MADCFVFILFLGFLMAEMNGGPCGGFIQTLPGSILTPDYPDSYPPSRECIWIIEAAHDHNVQVIFISFDIVLDSSCTGDKVEFKDGPDGNSPWIASYCGNISPPNITTTGRHLYIRFVSDETIETTGMHLRYDQVPACKTSLNDSSGFIFSPNYPNNYPSLTKCVWIINPPYGSIVQLTILKLAIEYETTCLYDSLEIYDGKNDSSPLFGKYCGFFTNEVLNSTSNFLFMQFISDTADELSGFNASYQVYSTNPSQAIGSFQNNKLDQTQERDSVEDRETTLMDSIVITSALTTGSADFEFRSTIYDPSLEHSIIAVSTYVTSEQESETTCGSSRLSSTSSQSETITEDVEISDRWTIEIMSSENSVSTIANQSGFETPMPVTQRHFNIDIAVSRDGGGESPNTATFMPKNQPSTESYDILMNLKTEQIQPTTVLENTLFIISQDGISTETSHHTSVENTVSHAIITILLPTIITLITSGIVIGVVCAIKTHVKKIANLKVSPVDNPL